MIVACFKINGTQKWAICSDADVAKRQIEEWQAEANKHFPHPFHPAESFVVSGEPVSVVETAS